MTTATAPATAGASAGLKKIAVIGGGTMGNGIAQVFATHGFDVQIVDARQEFVERAINTIGKNLDRVAKKQSWLPEQAQAIISRIQGGVGLDVVKDCGLVIEAVTEDAQVKRTLFEQLDKLALADLIGLDTCLSIMEVLHEGLGDSKYRPCPLLRKMVAAGWLGRKSGRGFYEYPAS